MMASVAEVKDFSDPSATNMFGCCEYSNSPTRPNSKDIIISLFVKLL